MHGLRRPETAPALNLRPEAKPLSYQPRPIPTAGVPLSPEVLDLTEELARNAHDIWAQQRLADGWKYGPRRNDATKEHPCLVPYEQLPESEKAYDRNAALETLRAIIALGYRVVKAS
jgi:RyR domain